jgi:hypothetical protein
MKRLLIILTSLLIAAFTGQSQNVGINDDNSTPNTSAMLDVFSINKGLLIPRIALTSTTVAAPVTFPEASLLVYNTATVNDVVPGYYYWNGTTEWIRLKTDLDPRVNLNLVEKSANDTLLIIETMVLASGEITLILPSVTSADDGFEVTIKNVGIHTDLITIVPYSGKTIDGGDRETLTRWQNHTFVASGSNWIVKDQHIQIENVFEVGPVASFNTIAEVVEFLNLHMSGPSLVRLGGGVHLVDATISINLPYPITFQGISYGETSIDAASGVSGSPMFSCTTETYFKMLLFNAISNGAGNDAIHFTGSKEYYEVKDVFIFGFNKGIVSTNNNDLWIFEVDFEDCAEAGIELAAGGASGVRLRISEVDFMQCAKGINLLSGTAAAISIINCGFYNTDSGTDIGVLYTPTTFTSPKSMFITNNTWNNQGTFLSGFDFTRPDGRDANIILMNNAGTENKNPHCKINVNNNALTTTITSAGSYYKASWTNTSTYVCKWTIGNNKITYQSDYLLDAWSIITGNISVDNINRVITIAIVRNGVTSTRYGETNLRITTANQPFQFSTSIYIPDMNKNDYLELYITSANSGDIVRIQDVNWFTNTQ